MGRPGDERGAHHESKAMFFGIDKSWNLLSRRQRWALVLLSLARVLVNLLDLVGIAMVAGAISEATGVGVSLTAPPWAQDLKPDGPLFFLAAAGVAFLLKTLLAASIAKITANFLAAIEIESAKRILNSYFQGGLSEMKRSTPERLEWAVLRATEFAFGRMLGQAVNLAAEASLALMIFGTMLFFDWTVAIGVALYFSGILFLFQVVTRKSLEKSGRDLAEASTLTTQSLRSLILAFKEISVLGKREEFLNEILLARARVARGLANELYLQSLPRLIVETGLIVGGLTLAGLQLSFGSEQENFVTLGVMLMGSIRIMSALLPLQRSFAALKFYGPQAEEAHEILRELPPSLNSWSRPVGLGKKTKHRQDALPLGVRANGVGFQHIETNPRIGNSAKRDFSIKGISLTITAGSFVAIVGRSGAGKSTLVDLILGLHEPDSGEILIEGSPPRIFLHSNPGMVGYVPQKPALLPGTLAENVAVGVRLPRIDIDRVQAVLEMVELGDFVRGLPEGLLASVGSHADSLSGGQIQRLGLARALYFDPKLLILDEATSALDAETEQAIIHTLDKLRGTTTIVVVAHRLSTVQNADIVHVVDAGNLLASGTFSSLKKTEPLIRKFVKLMSVDSK